MAEPHFQIIVSNRSVIIFVVILVIYAVADIVDIYYGTRFECGQMEETILVPRNKANAIPTFDWKI